MNSIPFKINVLGNTQAEQVLFNLSNVVFSISLVPLKDKINKKCIPTFAFYINLSQR